MKLDRVLAVQAWRDGPRRGVAELDGVPHVFEAEFEDSGEGWGDTYFLSPMSVALQARVLGDRAGAASARPLHIDPADCVYCRARFNARATLVEWERLLPLPREP